MSNTAEREELNELSGALLKCVTSLASRCGDTPAMRRIVNDAERILNGIDRLDIDTEDDWRLAEALMQQRLDAVGHGR